VGEFLDYIGKILEILEEDMGKYKQIFQDNLVKRVKQLKDASPNFTPKKII
jgi:hypothetical protein